VNSIASTESKIFYIMTKMLFAMDSSPGHFVTAIMSMVSLPLPRLALLLEAAGRWAQRFVELRWK
jgi:hypothetical protein